MAQGIKRYGNGLKGYHHGKYDHKKQHMLAPEPEFCKCKPCQRIEGQPQDNGYRAHHHCINKRLHELIINKQTPKGFQGYLSGNKGGQREGRSIFKYLLTGPDRRHKREKYRQHKKYGIKQHQPILYGSKQNMFDSPLFHIFPPLS